MYGGLDLRSVVLEFARRRIAFFFIFFLSFVLFPQPLFAVISRVRVRSYAVLTDFFGPPLVSAVTAGEHFCELRPLSG